MAGCPSCGSTGQANRECVDKSSGILWDGGALCIGISSGTLNDIIRQLSLSICNISSVISAVPVTAGDVTITGQIVGGCIASSAHLDDWVTNIETYLCALGTTVAALDLTEPLYYNGTKSTVPASPTKSATDTIVIPANTLNEKTEYLKLEIYASIDNWPTDSKVIVDFAGGSIPFSYIDIVDPPRKTMKIELNIVMDSSNSYGYDYTIYDTRFKSINTFVNTYVGSSISPVDFTIANNLVVNTYNSIGNSYIHKVRLTKFNKR